VRVDRSRSKKRSKGGKKIKLYPHKAKHNNDGFGRLVQGMSNMRNMKRLVFVLLVFFSCPTLAFMRYGGIPNVRASPSIFQGDLILTGNNVTVIEGQFNINGSILVENNATLILRNAIVNFTQTSDYQYNMTFENPINGNPRLIVETATIMSAHGFFIRSYGNSSCVANELYALYTGMTWWLYDSSYMSIANSTVYSVVVYGGFFEASNCTMPYLGVYDIGSANVSSSNVTYLSSFSSGDVIISDSYTYSLYTPDKSLIQLVNSTYTGYTINREGRVTVSWYLDVNVVDAHGTPVDSANVTATYSNATVAESELTDGNGLARLTLMEEMINATGSYPVGNYTITAEYGLNTGQESVNMTGNKEITISLPLTIPEFPSALVLPLLMMATLIAVAAFKRKQHKLQQP
jgi:hypothetical protein